ncbi:hypothetical protein COCNU_12G007190 [Cocos nucifera]|uniref:Uncharacterized protein n=1 Tax=Cocos nucifera TaxID=13894 RepID=A0A8K0NA73_COCNU|nr:hypothetical protein COCNU_12G007190 [Cocos nucifera]
MKGGKHSLSPDDSRSPRERMSPPLRERREAERNGSDYGDSPRKENSRSPMSQERESPPMNRRSRSPETTNGRSPSPRNERDDGLSGSSAIVCAALNCLLDFYGIRHLVKVEIRPGLILSAERELGIVAGLQDRVAQVYGGLVYMDFSKEYMDKSGHGMYTPMDISLLPPLHLIYAENPSDSGKLGVNPHGRQDGDLILGIPIKKRPLILAQSPPLPPQTPSSQDGDCGTPQKNLHCLETKPAVLENDGLPASGTNFTIKGSSSESIGDTNLVPNREGLSGLSHHEEGLKMALGSDTGTCVEEQVAGSTLRLSALKELLDLPLSESSGGVFVPIDKSAIHKVIGDTEFQMTLKGRFALSDDAQTSERSLLKLEKLDFCCDHSSAEKQQHLQSRCSSAEVKVDSAFPYSNRSNWDLNTTMDAWEGSLNDPNHETGGYEAGLVSTFSRESNGTDETLGNSQNLNAKNQMSSNLSLPINELHDSAACLNSQCKSVINSEYCATLGAACPAVRLNSITEMPFPSSLVKPIPPSCNSKLATCGAVKAEPCDERSHLDAQKVETSSVKAAGCKDVKTELCEHLGEARKATGYGDLKSACKAAVKSEPLENKAQQNLGSTDMPQYESEYFNKALSLMSQSQVLSTNHDGSELPPGCIPRNMRENVGGATEHSVQTLNPHNYIPCSGGEIPISTSHPQNASGFVNKCSNMFSEAHISEAEEIVSAKKAWETAEAKSSGTIEVLAQTGCPDGVSYHSSESTLADELHVGLHGNSNVDEVQEAKIDVAAEIKEESHDNTCKSDSSCHDIGTMNIVCKQSGQIDDYEDGEVTDMALHCGIEDSCEEGKLQQVNATSNADPINHLDVSIVMPSSVDVQENRTENLDKLLDNLQGTEGGDVGLCNDKNDHGIDKATNPHEFAAVGGVIYGSAEKRLIKTISNNCWDQSKRNKDPEAKLPYGGSLHAGTIKEGSRGEIVRQLEKNSRGSDILRAKASVLSKTESDKNSDTIKHVGSNHGRIIDLKSTRDGLAFGKSKSLPDKPFSSLLVREDSIGKLWRQDRSHYWGSRDENCSDRSRKFEGNKNYEHLVAKRGSNFKHIRSRDRNEIRSSHDDRNSEPGNLLEQLNSSGGYRFPRPKCASEVVSSGSIGNAGRMARKPINGEFRTFSRMPYKRRSPGERGREPVGSQMIHHLHPMRDISPSRCIGRDVPDFELLAHEEKLLRNLPNDMVDPPLLLHDRSQFERAEGTVNHRVRRSLSPIRQGSSKHIPHMYSEISPMSDMRSLHQWSPPRRKSDVFDGHPELIHCRSPPVVRLGGMRPPHQHAYFMEDTRVRRQGSPHYVPRLPDDMVDFGPSRENDYQRYVMHPSRNFRRFDLIESCESADEELCSPLLRRQFHEPMGDDDYSADRRKYRERHEPVRSMRRARDDNTVNFDFRDERDPRPFRHCREANGQVPERGSLGNFDRHIRNRLGNAFSRLRGIEEPEDNYRYHEEPRRRNDASYNNGRPKRRRL